MTGGSAIKTVRRRLAREAILQQAAIDAAIVGGYREGVDPVLLLLDVAKALLAKAREGDVPAIREVHDRVDGRVPQQLDHGNADGEPFRVMFDREDEGA